MFTSFIAADRMPSLSTFLGSRLDEIDISPDIFEIVFSVEHKLNLNNCEREIEHRSYQEICTQT